MFALLQYLAVDQESPFGLEKLRPSRPCLILSLYLGTSLQISARYTATSPNDYLSTPTSPQIHIYVSH